LIRHVRRVRESSVNAIGERTEVWIKRAENHAGMVAGPVAVQSEKMRTIAVFRIMRQKDSAFGGCEGENIMVWY
jgi:hypothetical protein